MPRRARSSSARVTTLTLVVSASCWRDSRPPPEAPTKAPSSPVRTILVWGGANHFASEQLEIASDGAVRYRFTEGDATLDKTVRLSQAELEQLAVVLKRQAVCSLVSQEGYLPVPEESQTTLTLDMADLRCVVMLWDNEWSKRKDSAPVDAVIRAIVLHAQSQ